MKQTLLSRLILLGLTGAALPTAQAGQMLSSSAAIAREVIASNDQTIVVPTTTYRFFHDVDCRGAACTFQIQFTLAAGAWAALPANVAQTIKVTDGITLATINQGPAIPGTLTYTVDSVALSGNTLYATLSGAQNVVGVIQQPLFSINATTNTINGVANTNVAANRARITGLYDVVGDITGDYTTSGLCTNHKTLAVSFKHFVALPSRWSLADSANATPDEHLRDSSSNTATLFVFPTNIKVTVAPSSNSAYLTAGGNQTFSNNGAAATAGLDASYVNSTTVNLGKVTLAQNATGYDSNLLNQYVLAGVAGGNNVSGLDAVATAAANVGDVETKQFDVKVTASDGFVVGGNLFLATDAACTAPVVGSTVAVTAENAAGPITVTAGTAPVNAVFGPAGTNAVRICYRAPGNVTIPSSSFTSVATLVKAAAGGNFTEQNNVCGNSLYSLSHGLKIDVRNYASSKESSGYKSVLRFVNNSDSAAADVWAQFIHQDGTLGNWAKIADLPVRGVLNMTADQIDAKLAAGRAATVAAGTATPVAQAGTASTADTAPRLRITSTTGGSLRVQNYLLNTATGQILEGSGQQSADSEGAPTRAPASDGQYQNQDANSGLNLGNQR